MITQRPPRRSPPRLIKSAAVAVATAESADPFAALRPRATAIRVRKNQQLSLIPGQREIVYIVRSGILLLQTLPPAKHRLLLSLLYPNDVSCASYGPPVSGTALAAATAAELWRLPDHTFESLLADDAALSQRLNRQLADQHARSLLHVAMLASLSGEERMASFLIELGLRLGTHGAGGTTFEIPLSRNDIADYLALNPDTLSRISSRLKARGLVVQTGRGRVVVPDWGQLCAQTPIADALTALHGKAAAGHTD